MHRSIIHLASERQGTFAFTARTVNKEPTLGITPLCERFHVFKTGSPSIVEESISTYSSSQLSIQNTQSAPAKLIRFDLGDPCDSFKIWEDPALMEEENPAVFCLDMDAELPPLDPEENKENLDSSAIASVRHLRAPAARSSLTDITALEVKCLHGKAIKISQSPLHFYKNSMSPVPPPQRRVGQYEYSEDFPPPGRLTRTVGSKYYRATSIVLFPKRPAAVPQCESPYRLRPRPPRNKIESTTIAKSGKTPKKKKRQ